MLESSVLWSRTSRKICIDCDPSLDGGPSMGSCGSVYSNCRCYWFQEIRTLALMVSLPPPLLELGRGLGWACMDRGPWRTCARQMLGGSCHGERPVHARPLGATCTFGGLPVSWRGAPEIQCGAPIPRDRLSAKSGSTDIRVHDFDILVGFLHVRPGITRGLLHVKGMCFTT